MMAKRALGLPIPMYEFDRIDEHKSKPSKAQCTFKGGFPVIPLFEYAMAQLTNFDACNAPKIKPGEIPDKGFEETLAYLQEYNVDLDEMLELFQ
jgi:hypothetical protein